MAERDHDGHHEARFWLFNQRTYTVFATALADLEG
jgi:hypothetical protein